MSCSSPRPRLLITGANGFLGRICYHELKDDFEISLVDRAVGVDARNRFALEGVGQPKVDTAAGAAASAVADSTSSQLLHSLLIPESSVHQLDLSSQSSEFDSLLQDLRPSIVLHLANVLESSSVELILLNDAINSTVLELCVKRSIKLVCASSIMVLYGAVMNDALLSRVLRMDSTAHVPSSARLHSGTVLDNTEQSIRLYSPSGWLQNLTYMQTKERLEAKSQLMVQQAGEETTIVCVRFGWASIRRAEEIEQHGAMDASASESRISETSIVLSTADLRSFVSRLLHGVSSGSVRGFRVYSAVSEHPQRWVCLEREREEFGWTPAVLNSEP